MCRLGISGSVLVNLCVNNVLVCVLVLIVVKLGLFWLGRNRVMVKVFLWLGRVMYM